MTLNIRLAEITDQAAIAKIIHLSARELSRNHYTPEQIDAALAHVFGFDTSLIEDGTYFIAEIAGKAVGCGGWSKRRTLFGGDQFANRDSRLLDPEVDPARIRAFFVHPDHARQGIGRAILACCETEAAHHRFGAFELMSTLPGVEFYRAAGYVPGEPFAFRTPSDVDLGFVPMRKMVSAPTVSVAPSLGWRRGRI